MIEGNCSSDSCGSTCNDSSDSTCSSESCSSTPRTVRFAPPSANCYYKRKGSWLNKAELYYSKADLKEMRAEATVLATRDWLLEVEPDDFDVTIITTYPGTPYYDLAQADPDQPGVWTYTHRQTGDRLHAVDVDFMQVADYYKGDPDGGYTAYVFTDHLSREQLVTLRDQVEREVRDALGIAFNPARPALAYEHSMGQSGPALPPSILRTSA